MQDHEKPQRNPRHPELPEHVLPPSSESTEQALLGALLLDSAAWERVEDLLSENDFYLASHREIFKAIRQMVSQSRPVDVVTVAAELDSHGLSERVGGLAYLAELAGNTTGSSNARRYAEIIRELAIFRELIGTTNEIQADAIRPMGRDGDELLAEAEKKIFAIAERRAQRGSGLIQINPILGRVIDKIQELHDRDDPSDLTGLATGFTDLDALTSGLQPGDLLIVAGRPSSGKTAFAMNIAEHVGTHQGIPVAIFSMEMSGDQLATRMLCSIGRIDSGKVRKGRLNDDEWSRLAMALGKLNEAPVYIDETGGMTPEMVRARARRCYRETGGKLGLIVIDYLQLMTTTRRGDNRTAEITEISRGIKALAKELGVPIIALSQLSRKVEERQDKRPMMSDLRESGAIEQDADVIMLMYREDYYNKERSDRDGTAEVIVAKQRNGPTDTVHLVFLGEYTRFENRAMNY